MPPYGQRFSKVLKMRAPKMKKRSEAGVDAAKFFGSREGVGARYTDRSMGDYMGIFGNVPKVSVYLFDADRCQRQASRRQQGCIYADVRQWATAPVKYFW